MIPSLLLSLIFFPPQEEVSPPPSPIVIHSVSDISQSFSFYMDGRFYKQYLKGIGRDVRNWGSLSKLDLSNANLLLLSAGDARLPYDEGALKNILAFAESGGTVLCMADGAKKPPPAQAVAELFGGSFSPIRAKLPLKNSLGEKEITFRGGCTLELNDQWNVFIQDKKNRALLAQKQVGKGNIVLASRGLFGHKPDASDPINASWVTPFLLQWATEKKIDPKKPHQGPWAELTKVIGPLTLEYHDGTEPFADGIAQEYQNAFPHLVAVTGVEPSAGMIKSLLILPTGGGGFSSGARIAIGAWWGNYPEKRYPMVELISHEAGHSWVLPHAEPLWNEPIATYLGIQVGKRMGMPEAQKTLDRALAKARKLDPDFTQIDPLSPDAPRNLIWGKSYYVFEELERLHGPGALAKYFRMKRTLVPDDHKKYTMNDCVAVWSKAVDNDLFPWFQSLGFSVDPLKQTLTD